jgi:hypothetical protein
MTNQEKITVGNEHYVNEATIELLRRRIESDVKNSFFVWIGAPIGGAGILAILFVLFWKMPEIVDRHIGKAIGGNVEKVAIAYMNDPEKGEKIVQQTAEEAAKNHTKAAVDGYFASDTGMAVLNDRLNQEMAGYFSHEEGKKLVNALLAENLTSGPGKDLLVKTINEALQPQAGRISETIQENKERIVATVKLLKDPRIVQKIHPNALDDFLGDKKASGLKREAVPIALTLRIRRGPHYRHDYIAYYIANLKEFFRTQFRYVLILDENHSLLARLTPGQMKESLEDPQLREQMIKLLNSEANELTAEKARDDLADWFGDNSVATIGLDWEVINALKAEKVWWQPLRTDEEVAVIDGVGKFIGTTSRGRLIEGIVS